MKKVNPFRAVAPPRRQRLSDSITEQIERLIVDGELIPGDALPSERDLAKQLGVSRPSLREALLLLESRGLVQAKRGGGFGVTDVTGPTITDPLEDADLDVDFHMAIAEASHNVALVHVMRGIFNLMRSNMMRSREVLYRQPENVALLDDQHAAIVKAIVARDHDAARAAANLHLSFIQASLREIAAPARKRTAAPRKR